MPLRGMTTLFCCSLAWAGALDSAAVGEELNAPQINLIKKTASDLCTTVKEARGQKTNSQIEGDVHAKLAGLPGKLVDLGGAGKGSISQEQFEGLTREATALALQGDRECRERVFNKMFDKLGEVKPQPSFGSTPLYASPSMHAVPSQQEFTNFQRNLAACTERLNSQACHYVYPIISRECSKGDQSSCNSIHFFDAMGFR